MTCAIGSISKKQVKSDAAAELAMPIWKAHPVIHRGVSDLYYRLKFIHACLDKMFSCETGLPNDSQASDQPDVAGRDVT